MTIESTFYDTSPTVPASLVTEIKWSASHPHVGEADYGVVGAGDFEVTAHPSTPFTLNVAPGKAWGQGVFDHSDAIGNVTCSAPSSGTSRWDLIALRRNWGPLAGGPTTLVPVEGGAVEEIPADRENDPGTLDDQPLYLVKWTAGQTQPTALIDLRCWAANGGVIAKSIHALSYLERIGSKVQIGNTLWTHELVGNGDGDWVGRDITVSAADVATIGPGFEAVTGNAHKPRVRREGNRVHLVGAVRRLTGDFGNMLTVPAGFRPTNGQTMFVGAGVSSNGIAYELALSNGILSIVNGYATKSDTDAFTTFPVTASWPIV